MNDIILVVLPDGSVHRATLIEPGLGAPVYKLGKLAGSKERKPRTKTPAPPAPAVSRGPSGVGVDRGPHGGMPTSPPSRVAQVSNT